MSCCLCVLVYHLSRMFLTCYYYNYESSFSRRKQRSAFLDFESKGSRGIAHPSPSKPSPLTPVADGDITSKVQYLSRAQALLVVHSVDEPARKGIEHKRRVRHR